MSTYCQWYCQYWHTRGSITINASPSLSMILNLLEKLSRGLEKRVRTVAIARWKIAWNCIFDHFWEIFRLWSLMQIRFSFCVQRKAFRVSGQNHKSWNQKPKSFWGYVDCFFVDSHHGEAWTKPGVSKNRKLRIFKSLALPNFVKIGTMIHKT